MFVLLLGIDNIVVYIISNTTVQNVAHVMFSIYCFTLRSLLHSLLSVFIFVILKNQ